MHKAVAPAPAACPRVRPGRCARNTSSSTTFASPTRRSRTAGRFRVSLRPLIGDWVFGCDLCQDACPVNDGGRAEGLPPSSRRRRSEECLSGSRRAAVPHRGRIPRALRRPARCYVRNTPGFCATLASRSAISAIRARSCRWPRALEHPEPLVRGHAAWALGRLGSYDALRARLARESDPWVREEITQHRWRAAGG